MSNARSSLARESMSHLLAVGFVLLFVLNIMGLGHMGQAIEDRMGDSGPIMFVILAIGLVTFAGVPWLLFVGVRGVARKAGMVRPRASLE